MPGAHETHASIEAAAAVVLSLGGAAILVRAWVDRRSRRRIVATETSPTRRPGPDIVGRGVRSLVVVLSAGAAAIHLAAGPEHVASLGDLGLAFYWAALFQAAFAVAWLSESRGRFVGLVGIIANALLIGAWGWSRTVGLPFVTDGPEGIGVADAVAVLLELGIVALLGALALGVDGRAVRLRRPAALRTAVTSAAVAIAGVAVLATTVAVADALGGHHAPAHGHEAATVEVR
jgi:hypothetical protein